MFEFYSETLESLRGKSHFRYVKDFEEKDEKYIYFKGAKLLNLSSNNYLGFADNRKITEEFLDFAGGKYPFGSASARLLTGSLPVFKELEKLLCDLYKKEGALIFNSGYHANVGIMSSLAEKGDVIFSDKLNHASIIDGMKLSGAKFFRYPHNNMESLENLLLRERKNFKNAIIITESIFSMDGDIADLNKLAELKEKYNCILIVDEAHAFGVFGENGLGVCEHLEIINKIDVLVGTFGKSIGSVGAFAVADKVLVDYLTNKARSFIFSTAIAPVNIAFSKWIIENKLPITQAKRHTMLDLGRKLNSESHIIPIVIGANKETEDLCDKLFENGYFTLPIRPPTVPDGTSRIRLSLTTEVTEDDLIKFQKILKGNHHAAPLA